MATRWQQLGAFVGEANDLSYEQLKLFRDCGGRYIIVLVAQLGFPSDHDPACARNIQALEHLQPWCKELGIACGGWFNGWAKNAATDAEEVRRMVQGFNLAPIVLDLEAAYKGSPSAMPELLLETRKALTTRSIAVSTNEPNDSMPWNGGSLGEAACMATLGIKLLPQWYDSPAYGGMWMRPDSTMAWLKEHGNQDNFYCKNRVNHRAIGQSEVHGTLEVSSLEGSNLPKEIGYLLNAKSYGYTVGFQLYLLESAPASDLELCRQLRGRLFYT